MFSKMCDFVRFSAFYVRKVVENVRKGVLFIRFYAPLDSRPKTRLKSQVGKLKKSEKSLKKVLPRRSRRTQRRKNSPRSSRRSRRKAEGAEGKVDRGIYPAKALRRKVQIREYEIGTKSYGQE